MTTSLEGGPEDDTGLARRDALGAGLTERDFVVGVSASGSTPYTLTVLRSAQAAGAGTAAIACNAAAPMFEHVDIPIVLNSGPEVLAGSTRMAAGTAQKAAFNMLSTMMAIRLGHVVDGMMVNVRADNRKLADRATRIVARIADVDETTAARALEATGGAVKTAILIAAGASDCASAEASLERNGGNVRAALAEVLGTSAIVADGVALPVTAPDTLAARTRLQSAGRRCDCRGRILTGGRHDEDYPDHRWQPCRIPGCGKPSDGGI